MTDENKPLVKDYGFASLVGTIEGEIKVLTDRSGNLSAQRTERAWDQYLLMFKGLAPLALSKKSQDRTDATEALIAAHVSKSKAKRLIENAAWVLSRHKAFRALALTMPSDEKLGESLKAIGYAKERDILVAREGKPTPVEAVMKGIRKYASKDGFDYKGLLAEIAAKVAEEISVKGHVQPEQETEAA